MGASCASLLSVLCSYSPARPTPYLCSCFHFGPAHSLHHSCSGTFQAGFHSSQTCTSSQEHTRPHLQGPHFSLLCWIVCSGNLPTPHTAELDRARLRLTPAGQLVLGKVEAHITFTVVPARYIEALSVLTEAHVLHAFILV